MTTTATRRVPVQLFWTVGWSILVGFVVVLNQFGSAISALVPIKRLEILWSVNAIVAPVTYTWLAGALLTLCAFCYLALRTNPQIQRAYYLGKLAGLLVLPAIALAITAAVGAAWLVFLILKFVALIVFAFIAWITPFLTFLFTPVQWLIDNVLTPIGRFIATPFVWLWEHFLREALRVLWWPFGWLVANILAPLFQFLGFYVLRPILVVLAGVLSVGLVLAPFAAIGRVVLAGVRSAIHGALSPQGAFVQGVGVGFICLDVIISALLGFVGRGATTPSLFLIFAISLPIVYFARVMRDRSAWSHLAWEPMPLSARASDYMRTSQLDLVVSCVMLPIAVGMAFLPDGVEDALE